MSKLIVISRDPQREVKYRCIPCGTEFYDGEEKRYERHVVACAAGEKGARMQQASWRRKAPGLFDPQHEGTHDVEFERWVKAHKDPLIRGDMKL